LLSGCTPTTVIPKAAVDAAAATALGNAPAPILHARLDALNQALAQERERRAAVERQLEERARELDALHAQIEELRALEIELRAALADKGTDDGATPSAGTGASSKAADAVAGGGGPVTGGGAAGADGSAPAAAVTSLRAALSQEQQLRQEAETQLARLKQETSTAPYGDGGVIYADFAAAKQEIVELRRLLDEERATRQRLAEDFEALQQRVAQDGSAGSAADSPEARARLAALQSQQQAVVESFQRSLAASQARAAELEEQLAAARAGAAVPAVADGATGASAASAVINDAELASVRAENAALRQRLDDEHRRTAELANKLKLAIRVTDLVFKMQAQQAPGRSP
jgi:hypothetical protein